MSAHRTDSIQSTESEPTNPVRMFKRNISFLVCTVLLLNLIGYVMLSCDKAAVHLWLNGCHTPFLDSLFRHYTVVGEWIPYIVVFLLLFYKTGWATYLLGSVVVSGLLSQRLKYMFDTDRPYKWFAERYPDVQLPFVDGVELSKYYSFPSGHTTTFFALFLCLSIVLTEYTAYRSTRHTFVKTTTISLGCFLLAVLGAYSRIYLSQHFLEDIFGGMILGVVTTLLLYIPVPRLQPTRFWNWNFGQLRKPQ